MSMHRNDRGLTLIELLISLSILSVVISIVSALLLSSLHSQGYSAQQDALLHSARLAMERMVRHTRQANRVLLPLEHTPTRTILALGGFVDNDADGRYDEDPPADLTADGQAGIAGIDDDNDGSTDEGSAGDDDEDGVVDEDPVNGVDDDGDGAVDEDPPNTGDDDGDGTTDEDPIEPLVYYLDVTTRTLWERYPVDAVTTVQTVLAEHVDTFQVQRLIGLNGVVLIDILLRLRDDQGRTVELQSQAFPRNQ